MASLQRRSFAAAGVGFSVFCRRSEMPGRAVGVRVSGKSFSLNEIYFKTKIKIKKIIHREYVLSELIEKRDCAAAARRDARPDASLPRSEMSQFLPASRFIT